MTWIIIKGLIVSFLFAGSVVGLGLWVEASEMSDASIASDAGDGGDDAAIIILDRDE